jgi:NAD(P)H dehydrogenase (quinone)
MKSTKQQLIQWPELLLFLFLLFPQAVVGQERAFVLVVYHSVEGKTRQMAEAVAEGAKRVQHVRVKLTTVSEATEEDVLKADAIIVGSPVYNANVAPAVQEFINRWPFQNAPLRDKIGAAFTTGGGISAGEELVQLNLLHSMLIFGLIVVGGPDWKSAFGASAVTAEEPFEVRDQNVSEQFLKKGRALGERVALLAAKMRKE